MTVCQNYELEKTIMELGEGTKVLYFNLLAGSFASVLKDMFRNPSTCKSVKLYLFFSRSVHSVTILHVWIRLIYHFL